MINLRRAGLRAKTSYLLWSSALALALALTANACLADRTDEPTWLDPVCELGQAGDIRLQAKLAALLTEQGLEGAVSDGQLALTLLVLTDPERPRLAQVNGDRMMYAASLPKILALLGAAVAIDEGSLQLDAALEQDLQQMVRYSCNECTNRVIERVGRQSLVALTRSPRFRFYDEQRGGGLWLGKEYGSAPAWQRDPLHGLSHGATTFQAARFYCGLQRGTLVSEPQNTLMLESLARPGIAHKFVLGLEPLDGLELFRKSGTWRSFHSDSALVRTPEGAVYVLVGLTDNDRGGEWLVRLAEPLHQLVLAQDQAAADAP